MWTVVSREADGAMAARRFEQVIVASGTPPPTQLCRTRSRRVPNHSPERFCTPSTTADGGDFAGRRVVVVGLGASAVDIAADLVPARRRDRALGAPGPAHRAQAVVREVARTRSPKRPGGTRCPSPSGASGPRRPCSSRGGDGLPARARPPRSSRRPRTSRTRSSAGSACAVTPKPAIASFDGDEVVFTDGTRVAADAVVYCTGFHTTFPFSPPAVRWRRTARSSCTDGWSRPTGRACTSSGSSVPWERSPGWWRPRRSGWRGSSDGEAELPAAADARRRHVPRRHRRALRPDPGRLDPGRRGPVSRRGSASRCPRRRPARAATGARPAVHDQGSRWVSPGALWCPEASAQCAATGWRTDSTAGGLTAYASEER